MKTATTAVPNGILFLLDPNHENIIIPAYEPGEVTSANSSCVSVATVPEVDGEVTVRLMESVDTTGAVGLEQVFEGKLETPSRVLNVVNSENEAVLSLEVTGTDTHVRVWVDNPESPGTVQVSCS